MRYLFWSILISSIAAEGILHPGFSAGEGVLQTGLAEDEGHFQQRSLSGDEILTRVDQNMFSENKIVVSRMIIHGERESRSVEAKSWQRGTSEAFTEFLAPAREKGTKMLKLKDMLWTYFPSTDRTILISGQMLRQSIMGSDLSYEDMMEDPHLPHLYSVRSPQKRI
jgi:hypothetical protein